MSCSVGFLRTKACERKICKAKTPSKHTTERKIAGRGGGEKKGRGPKDAKVSIYLGLRKKIQSTEGGSTEGGDTCPEFVRAGEGQMCEGM